MSEPGPSTTKHRFYTVSITEHQNVIWLLQKATGQRSVQLNSL